MEIPDPEKKSPFWKELETDAIKQAAIFSILSELRAYDDTYTGKQCRSILARCQAYVFTMDFKTRVEGHIQAGKKSIEELEEQQDLDDLNQ